jgi:hypothetical protein
MKSAGGHLPDVLRPATLGVIHCCSDVEFTIRCTVQKLITWARFIEDFIRSTGTYYDRVYIKRIFRIYGNLITAVCAQMMRFLHTVLLKVV